MRYSLLVGLLLVAGCRDSTAPAGNDSILGQYVAVSINGVALPTADLQSAWIVLLPDHSYALETLRYEVRGTLSNSVSSPGSGRFALSGSDVRFNATTGDAPLAATVIPLRRLRVVQRTDTLVYELRPIR